MGRLENIIARNRRPHGFRASVGMLWRGVVFLVLLGLLIFTDWALTDDAKAPPPDAKAPPSAQPPEPRERRIDGVPILRPAPRPR